jgi:hypothetical protein
MLDPLLGPAVKCLTTTGEVGIKAQPTAVRNGHCRKTQQNPHRKNLGKLQVFRFLARIFHSFLGGRVARET